MRVQSWHDGQPAGEALIPIRGSLSAINTDAPDMDFSLTDNQFRPELYPCDETRCFFMLYLKRTRDNVIFLLRNGKLVASATRQPYIWFFSDGTVAIDKHSHTLYARKSTGATCSFTDIVRSEGKMAGDGAAMGEAARSATA